MPPAVEVTVVGGGLAGMVAALQLGTLGCRVTLFEASERLGGKAGAEKFGTDYDDHGYHFFPGWYVNTWRLVEQLGIRNHFVEMSAFCQLEAGRFPDFKTVNSPLSLRHAWRNLKAGLLPVPDTFLLMYSLLDLMTQSYSRRALLDQISIIGFLRSRFYRTEAIAQHHQTLIFKSLSIPSYDVSAMTLRNVFRYWMKYPTPMYRILRGDLQRFFIDPLEARLQQVGCVVRKQQYLQRLELNGSRVARLHFAGPDGATSLDVDRVVLAIPADKLARLIDDRLYAAAPKLANTRWLQTRPMASLDVYLNKRIPELPRHHIDLKESKYGLSVIDVSQTWQGHSNTVLNAVAADFVPLETLPLHEAERYLILELGRYLPDVTRSNILRTAFQPHVTEPLFLNDVGGWHYRLEATTELRNLFLAGDYCRSHVDLVSMEGAITTALKAAEAVRQDAGLEPPVVILQPAAAGRFLPLLAKWALAPVAVIAAIVARLSTRDA